MPLLRSPLRSAIAPSMRTPVNSAVVPLAAGVVDPQPPSLSELEVYRTAPGANTWRNMRWDVQAAQPNWIEPAHGGDSFAPILHYWKPTVASSGRVHIRFHPAGGDPEIDPGSAVDINWLQPGLGQGDHMFSGTFPHSGIFVNSTGQYQTNDVDIVGRVIQYVRSLALAFGFDENKLTVMAQSRGNHVLVTAFRANLANSSAPTYAGRRSSIPNLLTCVNSQFAFNPRRAGEESCSDWATPASQTAFFTQFGAADDTRICSGDLIATAPQLVPFITNYDLEFPSIQYASADGKVPAATVIAANTSHWPQAGKVFAREYAARGASNLFFAWGNSQGGNAAEQMGYYPMVAREFFAGATIQEALATAVAKARNHSAIGIRSNLVGVWQDQAATTPVTAAGQPIGAVADMRTGIADAGAVPPGGTSGNTGVPGGQSTGAQRTTLVAVANGYGFGVVPTQRVLVAHTGTSNDGRQGISYTADGIYYSTPALLPAGAIGFGTAQADGKTLVFCVAAPLGVLITSQHERIYRQMMHLRRNNWSAYLTEIGAA